MSNNYNNNTNKTHLYFSISKHLSTKTYQYRPCTITQWDP